MDARVVDRQAPESLVSQELQPSKSIVYRVDHDRGVVWVTASGDVTLDALLAANTALRADPKFSLGMDIYVECRVLTGLPTEDELRSVALSTILHRADARHGRVAIVVTTAKSYEAAATFEFFCEVAPERLAVFTDPTQAQAWLGIDDVAPTP